MSMHSTGDHVLVGSEDGRMSWFDLDLGGTPYKTMRYAGRAVKCVDYHPRLPLFCAAVGDGCVEVVHGRVFSELSKNALIVPCKVRGLFV